MRHLVVLAGALGLIVVVGLVTLDLGRKAALDRSRVTAIFWPGTSAEAIIARVAAADGRLIRATVLPFAVEVAGDAPGIAERLEAAGAALVIAALPTALAAVGSCSYLPAEAYEPAAARLRPTPL